MCELFISYSCELNIFNVPFAVLIPSYSSSWLVTGLSHLKSTLRCFHAGSYRCWQLPWTKNSSNFKLLLPQYLSWEIWFPFSYCRCKERSEWVGGISHFVSCRETCPHRAVLSKIHSRVCFLIQTLLIEFYWNFPGSRMDLLFMPLVIILRKWQPRPISNSG